MKTMKKLIPVILLLCIAGSALANTDWNNNSGDRLWRTAANWSDGVPTTGKAGIRASIDGPIIDSSTTAVAKDIVLGDWSSTDTLDITGGTLTTTGWFILGYGASDDGTFNVSGGTTTIGASLTFGYKGAGHMNMTSGTVNVNGTFGIAVDQDGLGTSSGDVQLDGGTISCNAFSMLAGATMDITDGTLIVNGSAASTINGYITSGWLTAYGGSSTLIVDYDGANPGKTTVAANASEKASYPSPTNGATREKIDVDLSWLPGMYATSHDVYFGTDPTPDATEFRGNQPGTTFNPGTLSLNTTYYWRIDEVDTGNPSSPWVGDVWSFTTQSSTAIVKFLLMGDTQYILNTDSQYGNPQMFIDNMTQAVTDDVTKDAVALLSMGDMIETGRGNNIPQSYTYCKQGLDALYAGGISYVPSFGNNDNTTEFNNIFPVSEYTSWPSYVDHYNDYRCSAHHFNAGGVDWLVITAKYNPDSGVMNWVENLVQTHPDKNVIFISHAANSGGSEQAMLKQYENVKFVLCGHTSSKYELLTGTNGNPLGWIKTNWHNKNKDTYLCVLELNVGEGTADCYYYSPYFDMYGHDAGSHINVEYTHPWQWTGFDFGTPVFTSTEVPEGASARGDNAPDETVDNAFDGDDQTKWLDFSPTASWLQWRYPGSTAPTVKQYAITSANDSPARDPMDFNLLGSNDHGDTWDVLDSRTGETFPSRFQRRSFLVASPGDYNIYRLEITAVYDVGTATCVQLAELELPPCAGVADFNCNGTIGLDDFSYMAGVWLIDDPMADVADPAGQVDVQDMLVLAHQWLIDPSMDAAVAYWKLDETAGDVASDSSRNGHPGTLMNMYYDNWVTGKTGNALDFDGDDDYVASDVCAALSGRNITVSAWMKAPALNPAMQFIIAINSSAGDNKLMFGTKASTAALSFADSEPVWRDTTATVIDNTWHHIAFALNDNADTVTIYVDGSEALSFTSTVSIADDDLFSLGQEYDVGLTTGDFYSGQLDDVKVYDYALNETQIRRLYNPSGLLAHWELDETTGAVASDSSLYGYEGTLVNMDDSDWVPGNTGNALDFDGVNDYVLVDGICAAMAGGDVTVTAWVKAPAVNPANQFIISINSSNGDGNKLLCGTQAGTATLSLGDTAWHDTAATVIDNTWHHIAYVLEDSADTITVYVDDSEALSFASTVSIAADDLLSFGQEYDAGMATGDFYNGLLDDVRVYDRALSQAEIAEIAR